MAETRPPLPSSAVLTDKQQRILDFVQAFQSRHGYPPSIREIGEFFQIRSTNGVSDHLRALEKKGFLQRSSNLSRSLTVVRQEADDAEDPAADDERVIRRDDDDALHDGDPALGSRRRGHLRALPSASGRTLRRDDVGAPGRDDALAVPLLGKVAAGQPILALEDAEETLVVDAWLLGGPAERGDVFGLRVVGDSMIEAGILPGDLLFVRKQQTARPGEIAVAMLRGEATVKRWFPEAGGVRLQPENQRLEPIFVPRAEAHHLQLLGVVCGVFRKL